MEMLFTLLIHLLVLTIILYLVFQYLIPMIPDGFIQRIVQIIAVLIAIISLLRYIPGVPWKI